MPNFPSNFNFSMQFVRCSSHLNGVKFSQINLPRPFYACKHILTEGSAKRSKSFFLRLPTNLFWVATGAFRYIINATVGLEHRRQVNLNSNLSCSFNFSKSLERIQFSIFQALFRFMCVKSYMMWIMIATSLRHHWNHANWIGATIPQWQLFRLGFYKLSADTYSP